MTAIPPEGKPLSAVRKPPQRALSPQKGDHIVNGLTPDFSRGTWRFPHSVRKI
jgi:hypothetical protein